jgi:phage FluMu protein Com
MFEANPDITPQHALRACVFAMLSALKAIECPGCRKVNATMLRKELPRIIKTALAFEAEEINIGSSEHVH